jgi:hypothetical protein
MIKWNELINENQQAVLGFAQGEISGRDFYNKWFNGKPNQARQLIRSRGVDESRVLARKALRRRSLI